MDILKAMQARHSVRSYTDKSIEPEIEEELFSKRECFLKQFEECRCALSAMGDNTRQLIIRALMERTGDDGLVPKSKGGFA